MEKLAGFTAIARYNRENHVVPEKYIYRPVPTGSRFKMPLGKPISIRFRNYREKTGRVIGFSRPVAITEVES